MEVIESPTLILWESKTAFLIITLPNLPDTGFPTIDYSFTKKRAIGFNKTNHNGSTSILSSSWRLSMPETSFRRNLKSVATLALPLALTQLSQHSMSSSILSLSEELGA